MPSRAVLRELVLITCLTHGLNESLAEAVADRAALDPRLQWIDGVEPDWGLVIPAVLFEAEDLVRSAWRFPT